MSKNCEAVLTPTEESTKNDYSIAQAYAYTNAALDYEQLKQKRSGSQSLGVSYAIFEADLDNSTSAEDFQERVRMRLRSMGFSMNEQLAQSHYRRGLEPAQIAAWLECQRADSEATSLLLYFGPISTDAAVIHVLYKPGVGVTDNQLNLEVFDGAISGKTSIVDTMNGAGEKVYIVTKAAGKREALVTASIGGRARSLVVNFAHVADVGGMLGDTISIARCFPNPETGFAQWTPSSVNITAMSAPFRWISNGYEAMVVSIAKYSISFDIPTFSQYEDYGSQNFDGFVLRGFNKKIKSVTLTNNAPLQIDLTHTDEEVRLDISGSTPAAKGFALYFEFDE